MDGVLVDTEPFHEEARQRVYAKYGIPQDKTAGIPRLGRNTKDIFADVHRRAPFPVPVAQAVAEKRALFVSLIQGPVRALPGVEAFLHRFKGRLKLALVSASARSNVETVLRATGFEAFFEVLVCEEDVKAFKPDPEAYRFAARRLGVAARECVAFEDSAVGVLAARRAGARVVAVGPVSASLAGADLAVPDFERGAGEIIKLIEAGSRTEK
jgi:HAD superfamily hydrolase (TIGR01509 family)